MRISVREAGGACRGVGAVLLMGWLGGVVVGAEAGDSGGFTRGPYLQCATAQGVTVVEAAATAVDHSHPLLSTLTLSTGATLDARLVLDATGHARKLVAFDAPFEPGYQAAYGVVATVAAHPFPVDAMLFMDWRDDHTRAYPEMAAANRAAAIAKMLHDNFEARQVFSEPTVGAYYVLQRR